MKKLFLILLLLQTMKSENILIDYSLYMPQPENHIFEVELKFSNLPSKDKFIDFQLPVWRTGRYMIFDFASGVINFNASGLNWKKISKSIWRVEKNNLSEVTVKYKIYANEFNSRTRGLNNEHAFVDGTGVFMFVEKYRSNKLSLKVFPFSDWHVTTGLEEISKNNFHANNYDVLADSPLEIGNQVDINFEVDRIPHTIMIFGNYKIPNDTLISDFTKIIKQNKNFWGFYPYKKYVFMIHSTPLGGGGTEHLNSTIMGVRPNDLSSVDIYREKFFGLLMHEFFHTWNVKYLRPKGIVPYNYMAENYLEELWISEGTTSYYDELLLVRGGYKKKENFLKEIATRIFNDRSRPGNLNQSATESSFDAWVKFWKNTPQSNNFESDYYEKGANVSFLLDVELRLKSKNKISLDDLMREMIKKYPFSSSGFTTNDFKLTAEDLSKSNLNDFFNDFVYGVKPLPWEFYLDKLGLDIKIADSIPKPLIGLMVNEANDKTIITNISTNSPFYGNGIDIGDEIISINENRIKGNFNLFISNFKLNDKINLIVSHSDKVKSVNIVLSKSKTETLTIKEKINPTEEQSKMFNDWIGKN